MKDKLIASERMKEFYKDVKHWVDYDYVVINDELNKCYFWYWLAGNSTDKKKQNGFWIANDICFTS